MTIRTVTAVGGVVPAGDRDVTFLDSIAFSDAMAGTLGPVRTPDSLDLADKPVTKSLLLHDSLDVADDMGAISGLHLADSIDFADALAGTLGPVRAPDSIDLADAFAAATLTANDSLDISDATTATLTARQPDSLDMADQFGAVTLRTNDSIDISDAFGAVTLRVPDSIDIADTFAAISNLGVADSLDLNDAANATLDTSIPDSLDLADLQTITALMPDDSMDVSDARQDGVITNARLWPNTVVSNSNFTNPNNLIDTSESTSADLTATQSGGLLGGSSVTVTGTIIVSCPNATITPTPTIANAQLQWGWTTSATALLQTGNSVTMNIDYSIDDGTNWTTLETVTALGTTSDPTSNVTVTLAQINQLRFRATGNVVSGTIPVLGGATQTFSFRYCRIQFGATQVL